ncbi:MAG: U1 small nuclear ribonucleoprotein, partial [Paramarteilia canceri]
DPMNNPNATSDPYKTLFVGRLNYLTTESMLHKVFSQYGTIKDLKIVKDQHGNPKGYAFIEYNSESSLKYAYKKSKDLKIDGCKIKVDVERGRTIEGWRPRRLGGGLGRRRKEKKPSKN